MLLSSSSKDDDYKVKNISLWKLHFQNLNENFPKFFYSGIWLIFIILRIFHILWQLLVLDDKTICQKIGRKSNSMEVYPLLFQKRHLCLPFYATLSSLSDFYKLWPFIARAKMQFWSFFEFPFFSYLFKRPFIKILDRINQLQKVFIRRMNQFLLWWAWKSSFCSSYR